MTISPFIVILLRLIIPLSIFRYPLLGAVLSVLLDAIDVILVDVFHIIFGDSGWLPSYHQLDKWLDTYYFVFLLFASLKWENRIAKSTSAVLFFYRLVGMILFEITGIRKILFFFPNLFENFILFYLVSDRFFPKWKPQNVRSTLILLVILYIPKFFQEYVLHYREAQPWTWIKSHLLSRIF